MYFMFRKKEEGIKEMSNYWCLYVGNYVGNCVLFDIL